MDEYSTEQVSVTITGISDHDAEIFPINYFMSSEITTASILDVQQYLQGSSYFVFSVEKQASHASKQAESKILLT
jgi:hypothetical protein